MLIWTPRALLPNLNPGVSTSSTTVLRLVEPGVNLQQPAAPSSLAELEAGDPITFELSLVPAAGADAATGYVPRHGLGAEGGVGWDFNRVELK